MSNDFVNVQFPSYCTFVHIPLGQLLYNTSLEISYYHYELN